MSFHAQALDSSDFYIDDISVTSGSAEGIWFDGNIVRISEALCFGLARGDVKSILVTYSVVGRYGYEIPKTAVFNLSKTKDGPVISSHILPEPFLSNGTVCFNLLSEYAV